MRPTIQAADAGEFPYGWRFVSTAVGDEPFQVPLTLEDVLHPQEGDVIPETPVHRIDRAYLADVFTTRLTGPTSVFVTSDLLVDFGVAGMKSLAPDVGCFTELRCPPDPTAGLFRMVEADAKCLLVVEVVSPHTRGNDVVRKRELYHRAEVPLYALIDQAHEEGQRQLVAWRWTQAGYQAVQLEDGWLALPFLGLRMGIQEGRALCRDLATGQEIGDYAAITRALEEAAQRDQEREREMELMVERSHAEARARAQADARALEADARALEEAQARAQADARALEEAQARAQADARALEEAQARAQADARALEEAQARAQADARALEEAQARAQADARALEEAQARAQADARALEADARADALAREMDALREQLRRLQPPA